MPEKDTEYPKIRYVDAFPVKTEHGQMVGLRDPSGISSEMLMLSPDVFYLLQFFDGKHSQLDLRYEYMRAFGNFLYEEHLSQILQNLDANLFLENQNFIDQRESVEKQFLDLPVRPAIHAGKSYEADPAKLEEQIRRFFERHDGAGLPRTNKKKQEIKALLAPHIDIRAGGACYSHAYKALAESQGVDCFVILGTGHSGLSRLYSALGKDFETPFGLAKCDLEFIELLKTNYPGIDKSEILPHKTEHVIEFQLVFLKYLYQKKHNFTFVPILCSFSYPMVTQQRFAQEKKIVEDFSAALKKTVSQFGKKVCLIASVDFSHVGLLYGDESSPDANLMARVRAFDRVLLNHIENMDAKAFCHAVAKDQDRYRVCGFSTIYTMLNAMDAKRGQLLDYSKTEVDSQHSTVTFASMVFR